MKEAIINFLSSSTLKTWLESMTIASSGSNSRWRVGFATRIFPMLVVILFLTVAFSVHAANLTVDGSQRFQTIDGMGVTINVDSWNSGQLKPALDFLIGVNGSTLFRVSRDPINWVSSESLIPALHALTPSTLQQVYETEKMQDIWNTIGYLNQKGIKGRQIVLNFMGWTPTWIGGSGSYGVASYITAGKEKAFATMVASLVYYGKKVKGLDFTYLSPMNEQDWNCLEGPCVDTTQYTAILHEIADELNYMGITDVRFVGPDTASSSYNYIYQMMTDSTVAGLTDHLAFHDYSSTSISPGTSYTGKNYWLSETSAWCSECDAGGSGPTDEWSFATQTTDLILGDINNGFAAVLLWEAYDSFWYHHNASSLWGLLAYNPVTGIYTPRKRAYAYAHFNHFIEPGDIVIGSSESISSVPTTVAVYNATSGKIAIVGRNSGNSAITITGQLSNLPTVNTLALYETNSSVNLSRKGDISVAGGIFTTQISADSIFTLTNRPVAFNLGSPNDLLTISLVQKASNTSASALSLATTFPSPVTAGNLIVVSVSGWPNLPATTAVTDSLGNTYSIAGTILVSEGAYSAIYYAKNIKGGTNTITFNTVKSGGHISMAVAEFSGVDTVSPLDMTIGTIGSGTAPSSGSYDPKPGRRSCHWFRNP